MNQDENKDSWLKAWLPSSIRRQLERSEILRKIVGNTTWLMLERIVSMTVRFFVGVWLVRYLGPESYGVYSYALSLAGLFAALSSLGLDNVVIRNLTRDQANEGELLSTALALRIAAGTATVAMVIGIAFYFQNDALRQFVVIVVATQLLFKSADVFDFWFQSEIKSKYAVWVRSTVTAVYASSQVACILLGMSVKAFAVLFALQALLRSLGTWGAYLLISGGAKRWRVRMDLARRMMRDAWPLIIASLSIAVYMRIDQVMLGEMQGNEEVGVYATAAKISELWYFIPTAIAGSVYPKIVDLKESASLDRYRAKMQTIYDIMGGIGYVIVIPVVVLAPYLIELLFGASFLEAAGILQVHMWSFIFVALGVVREKWLVAENYTRFSMIAAIVGALVNVGLNYVLIPQSGGVGAAWATLWAQIVSVFLICLAWEPMRPVFRQMLRAILLPFRLPSLLRKFS